MSKKLVIVLLMGLLLAVIAFGVAADQMDLAGHECVPGWAPGVPGGPPGFSGACGGGPAQVDEVAGFAWECDPGWAHEPGGPPGWSAKCGG